MPFVRPLLAALLIGVMAGTPVAPVLAQEPSSPSQNKAVVQGGVPISLGVAKYDYSRAPSWFPNILNPYREQYVEPGVLTNSPRLEQLIHDGKMPLSLQDAIALAMENSMDIVVQRYSPWMADVSLLKARAGGLGYGTPGSIAVGSTANLPELYYDPVLTQYIAFSDAATPIANPYTSGLGASGNTTTAQSLFSHAAIYNTSYSQNFVTGSNLTVAWDNTRASSTAANFFNPYVQSSLSISFQQQLLNGAGRYVNRRNILITENNRRIADLQFAQQAITTITNTVTAYWELVYARENVKVQEQAVKVSEKLYSDNKKQLEIGTMAPLDVTRAESELASDRQALIIAQTTELQDQLSLKNYISKDPMASNLLNVEIVPTDKPETPATIETSSFEDSVKEAFQKRPDLQEQYFNLKSAQVDVKATRNALLPTATLGLQYSANGLAGNSPIEGASSTVAGVP
ncbi:MAG TPA: TolC family protein, partial [Candidatus Sulfotelmatobacter sp.]|nr:TolC family protein [Candidatus Sulfotelmatobacter sp.]